MTGVASLLVSASSLSVVIMGARYTSDLQNMALEDFSVKMLIYLNIGVSRIACYWLCVPGPYITSDCISNMYLSPLPPLLRTMDARHYERDP